MTWLHLIPGLSPPVCGVRDYARCLAASLEGRHKIQSVILPVSKQSGWLQRLSDEPAEVLLLHYSGYGYAKRGAPLHLAMELSRYLRSHPRTKLVTMFHELYATGPAFSSALWLSPLQRYVAKKLARLSEVAVTNRRASADWLNQRMPTKATVLPVFSNFGESLSPKPSLERPPRMVMFGGGGQKDESFWRVAAEIMDRFSLNEFMLLGRPLNVPEQLHARFQVTQTGVLDAESMGALLGESRFGLLDYNPDFLGKSTMLAAFAAFGIVPVLTQGRGELPEGLVEGGHFLSAHALSAASSWDQMQHHLRAWYEKHSQAVTADTYVGLVKEAS